MMDSLETNDYCIECEGPIEIEAANTLYCLMCLMKEPLSTRRRERVHDWERYPKEGV